MQRIKTLLQKLTELAQGEELTLIEADLMMDYTRVLYADLMERRKSLTAQAVVMKREPTLQELAEAMSVSAANADMAAPAEHTEAGGQQQVKNDIETLYHPAQEQLHVSVKADKEIRHLIGINDKYQLISELFGNNKEAYEEALDKLNSCANFQEALAWMDEHLYHQNNWTEDNPAIPILYDILNNFYAES